MRFFDIYNSYLNLSLLQKQILFYFIFKFFNKHCKVSDSYCSIIALAEEIGVLLFSTIFVCVAGFITHGAPLLVTLVAFVLYPSLQGEPLTAGKAFTSLALFDILSIPLHLFPLMINILVNAVISTQRILKFLLSPEVEDFGPLAPEAEVRSNCYISVNSVYPIAVTVVTSQLSCSLTHFDSATLRG